VPELNEETYRPRGGTPLLDAMGRTIDNLGNWISQQKKENTPEKIIVVFITDGMENSSVEFGRKEVVRLIKLREEESDWQFVFLSADLDAIDEAGMLGVQRGKRMAFDKNREGVMQAFKSASASTLDYRRSRSTKFGFKDSDRAKQKAERKRA